MKDVSALFALFVLFSVQSVEAQLEIPWSTIDGGGGSASGGSFEVHGTIGQHDAGETMTGGSFSLTGGFWAAGESDGTILGDVNGDGVVNLLDVAPFVEAISTGNYIAAADVNQDGAVNLLDVDPFVALLSG